MSRARTNPSAGVTIILRLVLALVIALLIASRPARSGGFLKISPGGTIFKWDNSSTLPLDLDGGPLGGLSALQAQTLVEDAISIWEQPTLDLGFATTTPTGQLTADGDVDTASEFQGLIGELQGGSTSIHNAIVFDDDSTVIESHFGAGSADDVLGFALIIRSNAAAAEITHTVQVYNGRCVEDSGCGAGEITQQDLIDTVVHEQGHVLNLDHVQVNGQWFFGDTDDPGFAKYGAPPPNAGAVNLMFPLVLASSQYASDLGRDELAAAEHLYGNAMSPATGVISGTVYRSDGVTPLQGVNVIARNTSDAFFDATSSVSGYRFPTTALATGTPQPPCPPSTPPTLHGGFDLRGLMPGESYTVEAVAVTSQFICGSSVGPLERPVGFPDEEFYTLAEGAKDATDPANFTAVTIPGSGSANVNGIDLVQSCRAGNQTISAQTITGDAYFDACATLTAASGVVVSTGGRAVLAADRVVLRSGFRVAAGGRLVVRPLSE